MIELSRLFKQYGLSFAHTNYAPTAE
jgi:hypothetical protein